MIASLPGQGENQGSCILCGSSPQQFLFVLDGVAFGRCQRCGLVRVYPGQQDDAETYGPEYFRSHQARGGYSDYISRSHLNRLTFEHRLAVLEQKLGRKGTLLDVGCALGDLLVVARERGWQATGLDISPYATAYARTQHGVDVCTGSLADLPFPEGVFWAITMYDVLEHLPDPIGDLQRAYRLLRPGGLLHVVTPNVASFSAKLLGPRWYHFKPREHLYYFSPATLLAALRLAGFQISALQWATSVVTPAFLCEALGHYIQRVAHWAGRLVFWLRISDLPFQFYIGEIEAWGQKAT